MSRKIREMIDAAPTRPPYRWPRRVWKDDEPVCVLLSRHYLRGLLKDLIEETPTSLRRAEDVLDRLQANPIAWDRLPDGLRKEVLR